ncbi:MAG TPA: hypothetical protein VMV92_16795 [Streptosporangiaceae bacterium]|nr:hypothetical protein [Streptosporangiaceae bacterium]
MTLMPLPPAWRRRPGRAATVPALPGPAAAGHMLAVASISQVISNATVWIVGILAGLATLFLTIGGVRYRWPAVTRPRSRRPRPR